MFTFLLRQAEAQLLHLMLKSIRSRSPCITGGQRTLSLRVTVQQTLSLPVGDRRIIFQGLGQVT